MPLFTRDYLKTLLPLLAVVPLVLLTVGAALLAGPAEQAPAPLPTPAPAQSDTAMPGPTVTPQPLATPQPITAPVGYTEAKAANGDMFGWITVPDTNIDYPVLQSPTGDAYYLDHAPDGAQSRYGSIYSEATYNTAGFTDRVTMLYGHDIWTADRQFHQLHKFEDVDFLNAHRVLYTYTDTQRLTWRIIATYTVGDEHVMYTYGSFQDDTVWAAYLNVVQLSAGNSLETGPDAFDFAAPPQDGRYLLLSTCNQVAADQRFLVLCVLQSTDPLA